MSREQFEQWERSRRMPPEWLERNSRGEYHIELEQEWQAWQAAYQAAMDRAAEVCKAVASDDLEIYMDGAWACERGIRAEAASLHADSRQPDSADATD